MALRHHSTHGKAMDGAELRILFSVTYLAMILLRRRRYTYRKGYRTRLLYS
jgi:hypothetical protein